MRKARNEEVEPMVKNDVDSNFPQNVMSLAKEADARCHTKKNSCRIAEIVVTVCDASLLETITQPIARPEA